MSSKLRNLNDSNFGILNSSKNRYVVKYDNLTKKFVLISPDNILSSSVSDSDLPDDFVNQIENEIDPNAITFDGLDGGSF